MEHSDSLGMELTKRVSQGDMTLYSGPGNIHSDLEVAKRTGLNATIAQGMMTLAYASELMTMLHGTAWVERGRIDVTFTKPVYAGDTVRLRAEPVEDGHEVRAENQHGDLVMVGTARVE